MPFSSQFALSLELTRILPINLVANKAAEAIMALARNLQNSGSDIVIEEDLASIFGRCQIEPSMAELFKTKVLERGTKLHSLCNSIALINEPGPTVSRAIQHSPYFATIVHLSMLLSIHEKGSLAEALHQSMQM